MRLRIKAKITSIGGPGYINGMEALAPGIEIEDADVSIDSFDFDYPDLGDVMDLEFDLTPHRVALAYRQCPACHGSGRVCATLLGHTTAHVCPSCKGSGRGEREID